ncbi:MAG: neutral/alkaline non-lysosomal ceramidase N-terminal domain-containing protein [Myxococcales bacterium]|nr:neutral/alkaline non-lysosomal ceramidase N-terminal domain-containing protein [Myxococcales bacterium]
MLEIGVAKATIAAFRKGAGMMGYGMHFNFADGVDTPLHARAFVFRERERGRALAFVCCEICFVSVSIKRGVVARLQRDHPELGLDDASIMLCAQHTHSGPGGYSHYAFYNFTIPGYVPEVCDAIVEAIVEAITGAAARARPAALRYAAGEFPPELEIAFNRSLAAYNSNEDVAPLPASDWHLAVDRTMELVRVDDERGQALGAITWFGVHATSLSNDNHLINWDNKGYAADAIESRVRGVLGDDEFTCAFAQATAGDVTPNYVYDRKKRWTRGKFEDDRDSARWHGERQAELAGALLERAAEAPAQASELDCALTYVDFRDVRCDPDLAGGEEDARTSPACVGVEMLAGTREGPGMPTPVALLAKAASWSVRAFERARAVLQSPERRAAVRQKYRSQGPKSIVIETGERRLLGTRNISGVPIPGFVDPTLATFKRHHRTGGLDDAPWTPQILPLQIFVIGELAIVAIPGELTTVAGRRVRATVLEELRPRGVTRVLLTTYANAYSGYICTREEYQHQRYEGSHTVFGQWTLAAYRTELRALARRLAAPAETREPAAEPRPWRFSGDELERRVHDGPFAANRRKSARLARRAHAASRGA